MHARPDRFSRDFHGASVFDLNRERERQLRPQRAARTAELTAQAFRASVKKQLGVANPEKANVPAKIERDGPAGALRFSVEPGIVVSAQEYHQASAGSDSQTLVIVGADRKAEIGSRSIAGAVDGSYPRVVLVDLPGRDSSHPVQASPARETPFGPDWREAFMALSIDRPLLGQRAAELLSILDALRSEGGGKDSGGFHVVGTGASGPVVLHAALLDDRGLIKKVTVQNSLVSWSNVVENGLSRDQLGNVVPGMLAHYDLPDLAARLAPLPLSIVKSVDAEGKPVPAAQVREIYAGCIGRYGESGSLEIR